MLDVPENDSLARLQWLIVKTIMILILHCISKKGSKEADRNYKEKERNDISKVGTKEAVQQSGG